MTLEITDQLTAIEQAQLETDEGIIRSGLGTFYSVGMSLANIRSRKLYRATHATFEAYTEEKWDMGKSRAYQLIDSAAVCQNLEQLKLPLPINESQTRALSDLTPESQVEAWTEASKSGVPTGNLVERIVDGLKRRLGGGGSSVAGQKTSWTVDEIRKDGEFYNALVAISACYGKEETSKIRDGTMGFTKKEILGLAAMGSEMHRIRELMMSTKWKPKKCVEFLDGMANRFSTVEDIMHWTLATKSKTFEADIDRFHLTLKLNDS